MEKKIGLIGCGNMGSAMLKGILSTGFSTNDKIMISERNEESLNKITSETKVLGTQNNKDVAEFADLIILAVKPNMYECVLKEIKDYLNKNKIIVAIAAGMTLDKLVKFTNKEFKIVKTMPNTPAMVGEGMSAVCFNENILEEEKEYIKNLFSSFGKVEELEEKDFDAFTALCGSSPAYVFMFIEAMADGAVKLGIPRAKAYVMAAQSILGSCKLLLETGKHPGELKDMVCSPGGTTIDAVADLEKSGFRHSIISAMEICADKSNKMK